VPIIPDEARTFGMESLFRKFGIYSQKGQLYDPVDSESLLYYREARDGQILEEGINEAGAMSSFILPTDATAITRSSGPVPRKSSAACSGAVKCMVLSELPLWYEFLFEEKPPIYDKDIKADELADIDLIVLVDVNSDNQLPEFCDYLKTQKNGAKVFYLLPHFLRVYFFRSSASSVTAIA